MAGDMRDDNPPDDAGAPPDAPSCVPRINEVQTGGPNGASDEFVEVFNPCGRAVDLDGGRLAYRSSDGVADVTLLRFAGVKLAPGGFLVCAGAKFGGNAALRFNAGGLAANGGGVALRDGAGSVLDAVGWGDATNDFVRGTPAPAPPAGKSVARMPDGKDSGDGARDFSVGAATPGWANK
jgi:hypothetical protein